MPEPQDKLIGPYKIEIEATEVQEYDGDVVVFCATSISWLEESNCGDEKNLDTLRKALGVGSTRDGTPIVNMARQPLPRVPGEKKWGLDTCTTDVNFWSSTLDKVQVTYTPELHESNRNKANAKIIGWVSWCEYHDLEDTWAMKAASNAVSAVRNMIESLYSSGSRAGAQ